MTNEQMDGWDGLSDRWMDGLEHNLTDLQRQGHGHKPHSTLPQHCSCSTDMFLSSFSDENVSLKCSHKKFYYYLQTNRWTDRWTDGWMDG